MKRLKQVLFIQGGGEGAFAMDKPLAESLRRSLGPEYRIHYPAMPGEEDPNGEMWRGQVRQHLEGIGDEALLVGHSVGAYVLLTFLLSGRIRSTVRGVFLVATPFVGRGGWEVKGKSVPDEFAEKLPRAVPVFLYHARDDEVVPFSHLQLYRQKLPEATLRELESGGHQLDGGMSIVAEDIKRIAA
jgi:predicted alpha/beta hydrolase family esterase